MDRQHLADLPLDGMDRIERTHRLLEDHGNVIAAHGAQFGRWGGDEVLPLEQDLAGQCRGRRQELEHGQRRDGFARAAFADQRHRFTGGDVEGDAAGGGVGAKGHGEIADGEQGGGHAIALRGSKASRTASPMKTRSVIRMAMVKKAVRPSQGA
ncbi:hypothetical protein D3C72_1910950 [compost metagenome]